MEIYWILLVIIGFGLANYMYYYFTFKKKNIYILKKIETLSNDKKIRYIVDKNLEKYCIQFSIWNPFLDLNKFWEQIDEKECTIHYYGLLIPSLNLYPILISVD